MGEGPMTFDGRFRCRLVAFVVTIMGFLAAGAALAGPPCPAAFGTFAFGGANQEPVDVVVVGDYAYTADTYGLTIYDVSDLGTGITKVGELLLPEPARGLAVAGNIAYVADGRTGLVMVDVSTPSAPVENGRYDTAGTAEDVVVSSTKIAYVADGTNGLVSIDTGASGGPALLDTFATTGRATGVALTSDHVLVAAGNQGLLSISVADPSDLFFSVSLDLSIVVRRVVVSGTDAFVAAGADGLLVVDVSDPTDLGLEGVQDTSGHADDVAVDAGAEEAYVADGAAGLTVVNIADPTNLFVEAILDTDGRAAGAALGNKVVFLADGPGGLDAVLVNEPDDPQAVASFACQGTVWDMKIDAYTGYVADGTAGLQIVSLSNPAAPSLHGSCSVGGLATGVDKNGNWAALSVLGVGLAMVDISHIDAPTLEATLALPGEARAVDYRGSLVYVADGSGGLQIVDVTTPGSPSLAGSVDVSGTAVDVAVSGDYAWVAREDGGIAEVDVSDPSAPVRVRILGTIPSLPLETGLTILDGHLYVVGGDALGVWDISDPAAPTHVATLGGFVNLVDVVAPVPPADSGTAIVYLADADQGFFAVDVSDPSDPSVLASWPATRPARAVAVEHIESVAWIGTAIAMEGIDIACPICNGLQWEADPDPIQTGGEHSTVTVTVLDLAGDPVTGATVTGTTTLGTLGPFSPGLDGGTYEATLTSGATSGWAEITFSVDGTECSTRGRVRIDCNVGPPLPPQGLTVSGVTDDSISLDWSTMTWAAGYRIYRGTLPVGDRGATESDFTDTGLSPGMEYCYTVTTLDACDGETEHSEEVCATTAGDPMTCMFPVTAVRRPEETSCGYWENVVLGDSLVLADSTGFSIWDVTDPSHPAFRLHAGGPQWVIALDVRDDGLLAVVQETEGVFFWDITDPDAPFLVGSYRPYLLGLDVAMTDQYAYVAKGRGFDVVDIHDPARPSVVPAVTAGASALVVEGGRLYVGETLPRLSIFDLSDPSSPVFLGRVDLPDAPKNLAVGGDHLYASYRFSEDVTVVDVSNPAAPSVVTTYTASGEVGDMALSGGFLWLGTAHGGPPVGLEVVDVSDPAAPVQEGTLETDGGGRGIALDGDTVYLGDRETMFDVIDGTHPDAPALRWKGDRDGDITDVAVAGDVAYVALDPDGLVTVDVSDPTAPVALGSVNTSGTARAVAVEGTVACVADGGDGLAIVDVSTPSAPNVLRHVGLTDAWDVAVAGGLAFVADASSGLRIVDVDPPGSASVVSTLSTTGFARGVAYANGLVYLASSSGGLRIVDVSDPTSPSEIGSAATAGSAHAVTVDGGWAYVCEGVNGLEVFDVSDPSAPVPVASYSHGAGFIAVDSVLSGTLLYVATWNKAIYRFDVSDPRNPLRIGTQRTTDFHNGALAFGGEYLYTASESVMEVFSLRCQVPVARFDVTDRGLDQDFEDESLYAPRTHAWDFGDGDGSTDWNPTHTYPACGYYTVQLTVTNDAGSDTTARSIPVGCDLDHDGHVNGVDLLDELAEIYDSDGILASEAGGPEHLGSSQYDTNADGILDSADLAGLLGNQR